MNRREFVAAGAAAAVALRGRGLFGQSAEAVNAGLIKTPLGALRGEVIDGVRVFRGVPFAEPPVGALRFKPPVKMKAWGEEREASRFSAEAMQDGDRDVRKSEDCLYLNVWTMPGCRGAAGVCVDSWRGVYGGKFVCADL